MADEFDRYFDKVNNANIESAKKQMEFQERMSSSSHQREVKDLISAGLNPVLSVNNGASSPMGAYSSVDSSPISAKFAAKNLNKELENARIITAMQNDNALQIAMKQLAENTKLGYYQVDQNNKTSRFNTIVDQYGIMAGLAYGLAEDLYNDMPGNIGQKAKDLVNTNQILQDVYGKYNTTAKDVDNSIKDTESFLDKVSNAVYGTDYNTHKAMNYADGRIAVSKQRIFNSQKVLKKAIAKIKHKEAFNKYRPK